MGYNPGRVADDSGGAIKAEGPAGDRFQDYHTTRRSGLTEADLARADPHLREALITNKRERPKGSPKGSDPVLDLFGVGLASMLPRTCA